MLHASIFFIYFNAIRNKVFSYFLSQEFNFNLNVLYIIVIKYREPYDSTTAILYLFFFIFKTKTFSEKKNYEKYLRKLKLPDSSNRNRN